MRADHAESARSLERARRAPGLWLGVACGVAACVWLASDRARAERGEYRLAMFELESDELHDAFARTVAEKVRTALDARADYALHETRVSLQQLRLAEDCNTTEVACLSAIARSLDVDGFLFGSVEHEGGAPAVIVRRFDHWSEAVDRSALAAFSSATPPADELERAAGQLLQELLGPEPEAAPFVHELPPPPPAAPRLEQPEVLAPDDGPSTMRIAGFALLGGAVLSTGLSVLSFVEVGRAERNRDYERYRLAVGERNVDVKDVCEEAEAGRRYGLDAASFRGAKDACSRGTTFEILQFVFIGSAVVSGGLAAYFLTSGGRPERPTLGAGNVTVHPSLARRGFAVNARFKF